MSRTRLVLLKYTTKTNKQHRPAPSHGTQLCNAYPLQSCRPSNVRGRFGLCATDHHYIFVSYG